MLPGGRSAAKDGASGGPDARRPDFFPSYAYGHRRYTQTMAARTPYGYVRVVPDCDRVRPSLTGKRPIFTDGCDVFAEGRRNTAAEAKSLIVAALEEEAAQGPVRAAGAAVFTHRVGDTYRVFLLDPGYMCPTGVDTQIELRARKGSFAARDLLTGRALAVEDGRAQVHVPAGGFRVLEVKGGG